MRKIYFTPYNTSYKIKLSRICAADNLPAYWFFTILGVEHFGTGESIASAALAAEQALKGEYASKHGPEPSPSYTPVSYANAAGYNNVRAWAKEYKKQRKDWIRRVPVITGWTAV